MRIAVAGGTGVVGRYVVEAAQAAGHDAVVMSRSHGVDVRSGAGLDSALKDVDVIVDAANVNTMNASKATAFFTESTRRLQEVGAAQGVPHLVTLSIVGIDRISGNGYYRAKVAQEEAAKKGPIPVTILRATQFHEFAAQILSRMRMGPVALMPVMRTQPVAARSVGEALVEAAVQPPPARFASDEPLQVAGPQPEDLVGMARALVKRNRRHAMVLPMWVPGSMGRAMRDGSQLPRSDFRSVGPRFSEWLETEDARRIEF